jgi:hypothetical protein
MINNNICFLSDIGKLFALIPSKEAEWLREEDYGVG